jgi:hypothetical protein
MTRNCPTAEEIEAALAAFRGGRPEVFDRLLEEAEPGGVGVCGMLYEVKRRERFRGERLVKADVADRGSIGLMG